MNSIGITDLWMYTDRRTESNESHQRHDLHERKPEAPEARDHRACIAIRYQRLGRSSIGPTLARANHVDLNAGNFAQKLTAAVRRTNGAREAGDNAAGILIVLGQIRLLVPGTLLDALSEFPAP
jgi:hypothetical protein